MILSILVVFCWSFALNVQAQGSTQIPLQSAEGGTATCHNACTSLINVLGEKVLYGDLPPALFKGYFSDQQRETVPACVVLPGSAQDVADAIKVITQHECIFAVKSGGHAMFSGASNAPGGITIDMRNLNSLQVSKGRKIASIGAGNRWEDVYKYLDPMNLTVAGGRDADVGVGGFLLGGGISFTSRRYGWGSDNVNNYERGGKNFGIVTRFDMDAYVDTPMWGGCNAVLFSDVSERLSSLGLSRKFSWTSKALIGEAMGIITQLGCKLGYCVAIDNVADMLGDFAVEAASDVYAQAYAAIAYFSSIQSYFVVVQMNHGQALQEAPAFSTMHRAKKAWSTNRFARTSDFTSEIKGFNNIRTRYMYETARFKVDVDLIKEIINIFMSEIDPIRNVKGIFAALPYQIISKAEIKHFQKNGGNCLGISPDEGPLLLVQTSISWADKIDDEVVQRASTNFFERSIALGKERGLHHPFIYQNYAGKNQEVFAGYGAKNLARLRKIQAEYDPKRVFTRLQPGYYNI